MTGRVLLVEDDDVVRLVTTLLLQGNGYAVRTARDGLEALDLLQDPPLPDLVVLDLWMPRMNGWQFRERLRRDPRLAAIPVLVVSAVADNAAQAGSLSAVGFLQKPVPPDELLAAVAHSLAGTAATAATPDTPRG
jgi:CheY-like chemotaxis protein